MMLRHAFFHESSLQISDLNMFFIVGLLPFFEISGYKNDQCCQLLMSFFFGGGGDWNSHFLRVET